MYYKSLFNIDLICGEVNKITTIIYQNKTEQRIYFDAVQIQ